jgi:23S rRNA (cytosine1962-C5)-methyltransferase
MSKHQTRTEQAPNAYASSSPQFVLLAPSGWTDYALLDSGAGVKLERFGRYTFVRPEPQAIWSPALSQEAWDAADAVFQGEGEESGRWKWKHALEPRWIMYYKNIRFWVRTTSFRHLGVFPEQASQWDWMRESIEKAQRPARVLNLFGYTGLATLVAARAGAHVTHVDASKDVVNWARENQTLSGLEDRPIRWIIDDALKYVQREARRQVQYDGLIIDPPKFGRGPKGEVWKLYDSLPILLNACRSLLSKHPLFAVLTAYAIRTSALSLQYVLEEMFAGYNGSLTTGEMVLVEQSAGRMLSTAIFSRWSPKQL